MNLNANLTKRERDVAELLAWGASKKEVSVHLFISERTVENHTRNIYDKTGCTKVNELSAWWFCDRYHIPMTLSPLAKKYVVSIFFVIYSFGVFSGTLDHPRIGTIQTRTITRTYRCRRNENNYQIYAA